MDQTCMIWSWDITRNFVECVYVCKGHRRSIEAVSVNYDKTLMATGAWDNMLYIWSTCKYTSAYEIDDLILLISIHIIKK